MIWLLLITMISNTWRAPTTTRVYVNPVPLGLLAWYDAAQITGFANGAALTQWDDLSGNANHATPGTAPTYNTNLQNGLPGVSFNGTTHHLRNTALAGASGATGCTIIATTRMPSGATAFRELCSVRDTTTVNVWELRYTGASAMQMTVAVGAGTQATSGPLTGGTAYTFSGIYDPADTTLRFFVSTSLAGVGNESAIPSDLHEINMGFRSSGQYWNQPIFEVMAWSRPLTLQEQQTVVGYLNAKWAITT